MKQNDAYFYGIENKFHSIRNELNKNKNKNVQPDISHKRITSQIRNYLLEKFNLIGKNGFKNVPSLKKTPKQNENQSLTINETSHYVNRRKSSLKCLTQANQRNFSKLHSHIATCSIQNLTTKLTSKEIRLKNFNMLSIDEDLTISDTKDISNLSSFRRQYEVHYKDTSKAWEALEDSIFNIEPEIVALSGSNTDNFNDDDVDSARSTPVHRIEYLCEDNIENDTICFLCKELQNEITYPCRICTKVFHVKCLEQKGYIKNELDKELVLQAFSNIGWSCIKCFDLSTLLSTNDLVELMEQYEFSDANNDRGISLDEFIRIRKEEFFKRFESQISDDDIEAAKLRFRLIDTDKSGYIDWVEYLNYECMRRLCKRPTKELVLELTAKEIQRARETFYSFDRDKGGTISEEEARRAFRRWYGLILLKQYNRGNISDIDSHVKIQTGLIMDAARKKGGEVSWEEYIQEQAIYILANRPNNPLGLVDSSESAATVTLTHKTDLKHDFSRIGNNSKPQAATKKNKQKNECK